jgi:hypothetical protein
MGLLPEHEPIKNVLERPDEASDLNIEHKELVSRVPYNFKAQVNDDNGKPLISTPQNTAVTITIPALNKEELETDAKADIEDGWTWSARYWLRRILKAIHFGISVVFKAEDK